MVIHSRTQSLPEKLQQSLSAAPPPPPHHGRQHSYDPIENEPPLPPGWEMAKTPQGQRYYLNHMDQNTTWHDPRKPHGTPPLTNPQQAASLTNQQQAPTSPPQSQQSPTISQPSGSLPPGWEQATTLNGEVYFINHVERTTSWFDPRIPANLQHPAGQCLQRGLSLPGQGTRQMSPLDRTKQIQLQSLLLEKDRLRKRQEEINRQGPSPMYQQDNQSHRQQQLQKLFIEKDQLRRRQEELAKQERLLLHTNLPPAESDMNQSSSEMTSVTDPFLGENVATDHRRQESGDSGLGEAELGGMGTNYIAKTPEDSLSNVTEMDTQDDGHKSQGHGELSVDLGNIDMGETSTMDSEDLVPSLQEDISNELLNDMESVLNTNRMENLLTWL